jgi:hypothetical protein
VCVGIADGFSDGTTVLYADFNVGVSDGTDVGLEDGESVGRWVVSETGANVGFCLAGTRVFVERMTFGDAVTSDVDELFGAYVGENVGVIVGAGVGGRVVGTSVGVGDGEGVGTSVGLADGVGVEGLRVGRGVGEGVVGVTVGAFVERLSTQAVRISLYLGCRESDVCPYAHVSM